MSYAEKDKSIIAMLKLCNRIDQIIIEMMERSLLLRGQEMKDEFDDL